MAETAQGKTYFRVFHSLLVLLVVLHTQALGQADTLWYGHIAFGEGRYDEAIAAYQAAMDQGSTWDWLPDLIGTVTIRKNLGAIAPADTHRIGAIYVTQLHELSDTGTTTILDVTPDQREVWRVYFGVFRQTLESFSAGSWTISVDTIEAASSYRIDASLKPDNPDHLDIESILFDRMAEFDSFITFSNTRSPAMGLARQYPFVHGVLYGPHRGMAAVNSGTHGFGILLHEFFHIVEWVSNAITPTHGYFDSNRGNFPDWTGTTEFDYYRWHFANTLPGVGWDRLNHRNRWIPFRNTRVDFDSVLSIYGSISLRDRQRADTLVTEGIALYGTDTSGAVSKWMEALSLSPFHERGLLELHDHARFVTVDTSLASDVFRKLKLIRRIKDFSTLDTANRSLGNVVALWHREDITPTWVFREWDLSEDITRSGNYDVSFYYTHGFKAIDIDSVSLLENSTVVSTDSHLGFSGNIKTGITYRLNVSSFNPTATYRLRGKIRGNGGVDSYGQIHLLPVTGPTSADGTGRPEHFVLLQNFPNPFNPSTTVEFQIPARARVRLSVYDVLGQHIIDLIDEVVERGNFQTTWRPQAPSGVYFLRMEGRSLADPTATFIEVKKMVLFK